MRERNPVSYLLNVIYLCLIALASPWLVYSAIRKGKYRAGFAQKFLGRAPLRAGDRPCIWLHAVSVGEVNLLATLLAEFDRRRPDVQCVISTTTVTGYALAKQKCTTRTIFYAPLDFTWAVNAALRRVRPDVLVLAELELWPNLISAAKTHGAKVAIVNGRLS
jgi:3-deoxy-D-manno-octulosonic-acid transferase